MRKIVVVVIVLMTGLLVWQFGRHEDARTSKNSQAKSSRAEFSLTDLDGKQVDSVNYKGKVVLVDFWATWCVPCESEIPHLVEWQNNYSAQGLQVVGVSMDDTVSPVRNYVAKHAMQYPVAMADDKTIAAFGGVLGLPVNILIGRDGKVITKHVGVTDIGALQKEVEQALAAK